MLQKYNAYIIKVNKSNIKYYSHSSELLAIEIDDNLVNYNINNDGTIRKLYLEIDELLKLI